MAKAKQNQTPVETKVVESVETTETPILEETPVVEVGATETPVEETQDVVQERGETETTLTLDESPLVEVEQSPEETPVEETPVETPKAEEKKEPLPTSPQPRGPRDGGNRLTRVEMVKAPVKLLDEITAEEIIQRKHNFDITTAEGPLAEIFEFLNRYETTMSPSANPQLAVAESLQKQLFKNYLKILGLEPIERTVAMEFLLFKFFRNEKRTFRVNELCRFTRNGKWQINELQMFLQLNNVFNLIKDPADRIARLRTIDLGSTVGKFPSEKSQYTESFIAWATTLK